MELISRIREKAKANPKKIVLPEANDLRVLKAAFILNEQRLVVPVLLGDEQLIKQLASENSVNIDGINIINPSTSSKNQEYAELYFKLRKHKGMTREQAVDVVKESLFLCGNDAA